MSGLRLDYNKIICKSFSEIIRQVCPTVNAIILTNVIVSVWSQYNT